MRVAHRNAPDYGIYGLLDFSDVVCSSIPEMSFSPIDIISQYVISFQGT